MKRSIFFNFFDSLIKEIKKEGIKIRGNLFLKVNKDKKFEISQEVYDAALRELKKSFRWGEEMAMIIFFKKNNDVFYGDEFYDSDWIIKNSYGYPSPIMIKARIKKVEKKYL